MLKATDDSELAAAAIAGDREAFRRLVERHYDMIYRVAYRYLGSAADAEDIAQDVCVTLATKLARFSGRSLFSTWLVSIVINRCRDSLRRRKSSQVLVEKYARSRAAEDADQADTEQRVGWLQRCAAEPRAKPARDSAAHPRRGPLARGGGEDSRLRREHGVVALAYGEEAAEGANGFWR